MQNTPADEEIATFLVQHFGNSTAFFAFLQTHVWPRFALEKQHTRELQQRQIQGMANARFCDLDGSLLSDREVQRRAKTGSPVREKSTGRLMRYKTGAPYPRGTGAWVEDNSLSS